MMIYSNFTLLIISLAILVVLVAPSAEASTRYLKRDGPSKGVKRGKKAKNSKSSKKHANKLTKEGNDPIDKVVEAIGGEDALMAMKQLVIVASGSVFQRFENEVPEDTIPVATYDQTYTMDIENEKLRVDTDMVPLFEVFQFFGPQSFTRCVDGNVGGISPSFLFYAEGSIPSENVASLKRQVLFFNPHLLLQQAIQSPDLIISQEDSLLYISDPVWNINIEIGDDGFISSLTTMETNPLARDTEIVVKYSDWTLGDSSLFFPAEVAMYAGGAIIWEETRTMVDTAPDDVMADLFDLPGGTDPNSYIPENAEFGMQSMHNQEPFFFLGFFYPVNGGFYTPDPVEVLGGVYLFSSVANSLVIRHGGGLVVVEAPGGDLQGQYLVDAVESVSKGDSVTHLVQSHHHIDHSGSCRYFLGATNATNFVVGYGVKTFWEEVLAANSMVRPDTISESGVYMGNVIEVDELGSLVLVDTDNLSVTVHHTNRDPHAMDAVIVQVDTVSDSNDDVRVIYQADMYNGGYGGTVVVAGPESLFAALKDIGIIDESCQSEMTLMIISSHGSSQTLEESLEELDMLGVDVGCPETYI